MKFEKKKGFNLLQTPKANIQHDNFHTYKNLHFTLQSVQCIGNTSQFEM